jgi:lysophospholipase L1-like esterase
MGNLSGRRILFIGDSLSVSNFGPRLEGNLAAQGAEVLRDAKGGRSVRWFYANGGKLDAGRLPGLVKQIDPTDVVMALGTNDAGFGPADGVKWWTRFQDDIRKDASGPVRFYWVTPPEFDERAGKVKTNVDAIREAFVPLFDGVVDSRPLTLDLLTPAQGRMKDYIHFAKKAAGELWADRVTEKLLGVMSGTTQPPVRVETGDTPPPAASSGMGSKVALVGGAIFVAILLARLTRRD